MSFHVIWGGSRRVFRNSNYGIFCSIRLTIDIALFSFNLGVSNVPRNKIPLIQNLKK